MTRRVGDRTRKRREIPEGRQALWGAIRFAKRFSLAELLEIAEGVGDGNARAYLRVLVAAGYLQVQPRRRGLAGSENRYRLVRDGGPLPPIPSLDGSLFDPNTRERWGAQKEPVEFARSARDVALEQMREQGIFGLADLERWGLGRANARKYLQVLVAEGLVLVEEERKSGPRGHPTIYRFAD
jgi:hypothetical protein